MLCGPAASPALDSSAGARAGRAPCCDQAQIALANRVGGNVLLYGESGPGKELVASGLHERSGPKGRFVAVNAATLVATPTESRVFDNLANYPNHGQQERLGFFGDADGGTRFLGEFTRWGRRARSVRTSA